RARRYGSEARPALVLGLGCLYAQGRTCVAPCLVRVSEEAYRGLASEAAAVLADPAARPPETAEWLKPWVAAAGGPGLVVEAGKKGLELYPVHGGRVFEAGAVLAPAEELAAAVEGLGWPHTPPEEASDWPWLSAWIHGPHKAGGFVPVADPSDRGELLARLRELGAAV